MATLPSRDDIARRRGQAPRGVVSYDIGPAQTQVGGALADAGRVLTQMAEEERGKLDRLKVEDRITQLMQSEIELSQEYEAVKGEGVITKDFHEGSTGKYQARIADLSRDLTDDQRAAFETTAKRRGAQFDAGRYNYAARESENYFVNQNAARLKTWQDKAAAGYANPAVLQEALIGTQVDTAKELARQGYTNPKSDVVVTKLAEATANIWGRVLDRALTNNDVQGATQLYASAKGLLSDEQRRSFDARIKPINDFAEGQQLALAASKMTTEGKTPEEVELYLSTKASSPGAYTAAQTVFTNIQQAGKRQEAETRGTVLEMFSRSGANAGAMAKVLSSPEYSRLSEAQQGEVSNYMRENARQAVSEQRADISWAQSQADRRAAKQLEAKGFQGLDKFLQTLESPEFTTMSRAQIFALAPEIGTQNVTRLLSEQAAQKNGAAKFAIDETILNAAIPQELYGEKNKAKLNAFKGHVESALMDWKAANPGKTPDPDTQRKIASSANAKWVEVKNFWPDKEYTAFEGPPKAWVEQGPPKGWVTQLRAAAERKGKALSQAQIEQAWRAQTPEQFGEAWRAQSLQGQ